VASAAIRNRTANRPATAPRTAPRPHREPHRDRTATQTAVRDATPLFVAIAVHDTATGRDVAVDFTSGYVFRLFGADFVMVWDPDIPGSCRFRGLYYNHRQYFES
jgi:uncharacterized MAPEG superfamily protein